MPQLRPHPGHSTRSEARETYIFRYLVFGGVSGARLVATWLLAAFVPVATVVSPLVIVGLATAVVAGVAVHESVFHSSAAAESVAVERA